MRNMRKLRDLRQMREKGLWMTENGADEWLTLREAQELLSTNPATAIGLRTLQEVMRDPSRRAQEWERQHAGTWERGWRTRGLIARKVYLLRRSWVEGKIRNAR